MSVEKFVLWVYRLQIERKNMVKHVLIVDDDPHIREVVQFALEKAGYASHQAENGVLALEAHAKHPADLIILDISMPEMSGLDACREIRKTSDVPVLFLSSRDEEIDRVIGFEIGGDDYVTKPFSPRELVARVSAILKRANGKASEATIEESSITLGQLSMHPERHEALYKQHPLTLTSTEFAILYAILSKAEKVHSRDNVLDNAYADNMNVSDRTIDSHIKNIRKKLTEVGCDSVIETIHGVGFRAGTCT